MAISYGSCKICDKRMQLQGRLFNSNINLMCEDKHYYTTVSEDYQSLEEVYYYGKYTVKIWFFENEAIEYGFYFPFIEKFGSQLCIPAHKVKFDPKDPHSALNKVKTIVNFS